MPYINTKTNVSISDEKATILKEKMAKIIEIIPGKTEAWLMLGFEDKIKMFFQGIEKPMAFVEVMLLGKAAKEDYNKTTAAITEVLFEELGIAKDMIYVKYEEVTHWGYNGHNF